MVTHEMGARPRLVTDADTPAADGLFLRFSGDVARLAYRLVGRDGDVDDLVQDVFLAAHQSMPVGLPERDTERWLAKVAVRLSWRRLRRQRIARFFGFGDDGPDELEGTAVSPETRAVVAQLYRRLDTLPVADRIAWTLRHIENEPLDDVARLCGCSLATAKRRIAAAQRALTEGT